MTGLCKNTIAIINACKQVLQSYEDYETETMTTPITVVQACEQLNYLLEDIRNNKAGIPACVKSTEQPNQNIMIVKTIQSLMTVINNNLEKLNENTIYLSCHRNSLVLKALKEIDLFEKTTLFDLQKAFE